MTQEPSFYLSGSVCPAAGGSPTDYSLGGENGLFQTANVGKTDLLPVFKALGAIAAGGSLQREQVQIQRKKHLSRAQAFCVYTGPGRYGYFAVLEYRGSGYAWDGGHCCLLVLRRD